MPSFALEVDTNSRAIWTSVQGFAKNLKSLLSVESEGTACRHLGAGEGKKGANPKWLEEGMHSKETMAYVTVVGDGLLDEWIKLVQELRVAGIKTDSDFLAKRKPKLPAQFLAVEKDEVTFDVLLAGGHGDELKQGLVIDEEQKWESVNGKKVKVQATDHWQGAKLKQEELIDWIKRTPTYLGWSSGKLI